MRSIRVIMVALALTQIALADGRREHTKMATKEDREQILQHIHSIFQAFLRQDRDTIRKAHTPDWTGFQGPSARIERGIDAYMVNVEKSLQNLHGTGYELLDTEVQIYGDLALVYYIARYDYRDGEGREGSIPLRSLDVYRREQGKWNQCGSHIAVIPAVRNWGEEQTGKPSAHDKKSNPTGATAVSRNEPTLLRLLAAPEREDLLKAREAVWRAWFAGDQVALRAAVPDEAIAMDPGVADWADQDEILRRSSTFAAGGKLLRLEFPETRMQVYGNVAILYTSFVFETQQDGQRNVTTGRGTEVFVNRDGKWVNTGWHLEAQEAGATP